MSLLTPTLAVILIWWIGTGVVLYLQQRIERAGMPLISTLIAVALAALCTLWFSAQSTAPEYTYAGFIAAVCLWGCLELSYYTGLISGVHQRSCPTRCSTGKRFRLALGASLWHELSVLGTGMLVITLLFNAENSTGLSAFLVLWLMRWSAKLNLFFGMPNFNTDWFPARMAYAHSYIRRAPVTLFFPLSMLLASIIAWKLFTTGLSGSSHQVLPTVLVGVLLLLAILEHIFMALPIADSALWNRIFARDETTLPADTAASHQSPLMSGKAGTSAAARLKSSLTPSAPVSFRQRHLKDVLKPQADTTTVRSDFSTIERIEHYRIHQQ